MPKGVSTANQEAESTNEEECTRPNSKFVCVLRIDTHKSESNRKEIEITHSIQVENATLQIIFVGSAEHEKALLGRDRTTWQIISNLAKRQKSYFERYQGKQPRFHTSLFLNWQFSKLIM